MKHSNPVNIGVVGVGHLGRLHVKLLKQIPEANLVGIYDVDPNRAREIHQEFDVNIFASFDALLESVDAVSIVTPTVTHFDYARKSMQAGKHVFVEKPITESVEEAEQLLQVQRQAGVKLQVGHIERFNPAIMALQPLHINPLFIESHRLSNFDPRGTDVAVVLDLMIHDIDLILSFVPSRVVEVHASGARVISAHEDIANCRLMFENGCVANVTASRISARKMRKMRFFQPNAYISVDFLEGASEVYYIAGEDFVIPDSGLAFSLGAVDRASGKKEIRYARLEKADINPLQYELQSFCRAILEDSTPLVTGEEALRALKVARQILSSIEAHTELVKKHWRML